jgi:uncharacterized protein YjbJ (UPF0337 family)
MHAPNPQGSNHQERVKTVTQDAKDEFVTQSETGEQAPVDEVEGRVEAEMKRIEGAAREAVAQGTQNPEREREGRELREEGERELDEQREE